MISNREKRGLWEHNYFEIRNSFSYSISYTRYSDLKLSNNACSAGCIRPGEELKEEGLIAGYLGMDKAIWSGVIYNRENMDTNITAGLILRKKKVVFGRHQHDKEGP